ncbi:MAG: Abi family protein [Herbiconiux sp.]|uniref:Abi family protein n=1 Tax=Herbiconiux sp. TaxID=1871186 RepID=UPI0012244B91|nr:Abi family protein [Herbiconiux sp.]TAJ46505.1 MAG: Abi family protein [Herbiconiux sp.]
MPSVKQYRDYDDLIALLVERGMDIGGREGAIRELKRVSYYRLSGYWYPFRKLENAARQDDFYPGTTLVAVLDLYRFDQGLRSMTFAALGNIELAVRASLGHALGALDEGAHLRRDCLGPTAQGRAYDDWVAKLGRARDESREDFIEHHARWYVGTLPVWVAVELLDWGGLARLYGFATRAVQDRVAVEFNLSAPQFGSWLKALNVVRNVCAHHGRLFNRVFAIAPKLPTPGRFPQLDECGPFTRAFGHLSMIQFLLAQRGLGKLALLPAVLKGFPSMPTVNITHLGAPRNWAELALWKST